MIYVGIDIAKQMPLLSPLLIATTTSLQPSYLPMKPTSRLKVSGTTYGSSWMLLKSLSSVIRYLIQEQSGLVFYLCVWPLASSRNFPVRFSSLFLTAIVFTTSLINNLLQRTWISNQTT